MISITVMITVVVNIIDHLRRKLSFLQWIMLMYDFNNTDPYINIIPKVVSNIKTSINPPIPIMSQSIDLIDIPELTNPDSSVAAKVSIK